MEIEYYNYNGDEMLILNNDDIIKNMSIIEAIYKDYEMLEGEVIINDSIPALIINGHFVARVNNDITKPRKLNSLEIKRNNIYAYIKKGPD